MANTTNLNLVKPAGTDKALVSVLNSNSDKIDAWAGSTNQALANTNNKIEPRQISDCNNAKNTGRYLTINSTTNAPASGHYLLDVIKYSDNEIIQVAQETFGSGRFVRNYYNGTWGAWQQLALKSDVDKLFTNTSARYIKHFMFQNTKSIAIDLQHEQTNQYFSMIEVVNSNQAVLSQLEGSTKRNYGGKNISMALSGSTATITMDDGGTFWGITHVTLTTNYQLI